MSAFDVVIPCFNDQARVGSAVESAFGAGAARVIVVDDGSDEPISAPGPAEVIRQQNAGPGAARNTGLEASTAPWVVLLDSDDTLLPEIAGAVAMAEKLGASGAVANRWFVQTDGRRRKVELPGDWLHGTLPSADDAFATVSIFSGTGQVVSRAAIDAGVRYDAHIRCGEDMEFVHKLALHGPVAVFDEPVALYNVPTEHNLSGTANIDRAVSDVFILLERHIGQTNPAHWEDRWKMLLRQYATDGRSPRVFREFARVGRAHGWGVPLKRKRQFWTRYLRRRLPFGAR